MYAMADTNAQYEGIVCIIPERSSVCVKCARANEPRPPHAHLSGRRAKTSANVCASAGRRGAGENGVRCKANSEAGGARGCSGTVSARWL
ncbi:hypothetical protein OH77DRAFT_1099629 [Trametes cingulata]|nr:hypothetical protein OH77DRAFT_1099629 [Trametes cingulata]